MNILVAKDISMIFGGLRAIDQLSFNVQTGQFFGIIGANGAGKTTLLDVLTGYRKPTTGSIEFNGKVMTGEPPYRLAHRGMARTFQIVQPFLEMTVLENVVTGALFSRNGRQRSLEEALAFCKPVLAIVGLADKADLMAGGLTLGGKKKLELARALATEPSLLLLDEVMGGLIRSEIDDISSVLRRINASGTTIVMVEHLVHVITGLCDHVLVLDFGRELFQGKPGDVVAHPEVIHAYLGKPLMAE
jgi:branched-chain amino acid transport system ATP-binding protein